MLFRRKKVDIDAFIKVYENDTNAVLLDVRSQEEYKGGHIPGSVNVPLGDIQQYDEEETRMLYVYCRSGARSARAVRQLSAKGYRAKNIGGIINYHGPLKK